MRPVNLRVRTNLPDAAERRRLRRKVARQFAARVVEAYHPACIILYGSVARDADTLDSDVDLIVIGGDLPSDPFDRLGALMRLNGTIVPIEPLGYSEAEFERMLARLHVTALEALEFGIPLYGESYFVRLKEQFERLKAQGLHRTSNAWTMTRKQA